MKKPKSTENKSNSKKNIGNFQKSYDWKNLK